MTGEKPSHTADLRMIFDIVSLVVTEARWFWCTFLIVVLLGGLYLNLATKQYSASMMVAPSDIGGGTETSRLGAAAGVASSLGISLGQDSSVSAYDQFINTLASPDVSRELMKQPRIAQRIFGQDWDAERGVWRQNPSMLNALIGVARTLLGRPQWTPPTAERLAEYISKNVSISKVGLSNIYTLQYKHSDPAFARYFLDATQRASNDLIREQYVTRLTAHSRFLTDQLNATPVAEVRVSLAAAIVQDQKLLASAKSGLPFAARPISGASVGERPVSPSTGATAVFTVLLGGLLSLAVAYLARYRWRRRSSAV